MSDPKVDATPDAQAPLWLIAVIVSVAAGFALSAFLGFRSQSIFSATVALAMGLPVAWFAAQEIKFRITHQRFTLFDGMPWLPDAYAFGLVILASVHVGLALTPLSSHRHGAVLSFAWGVWLAWRTLPRLAMWMTGKVPPEPPVEKRVDWPSRRRIERAKANR